MLSDFPHNSCNKDVSSPLYAICNEAVASVGIV